MKTVRAAIRVTDDEVKALSDLAHEYGASESDLIEGWVRHALRGARIRRAIIAYDRDEVDLRGGAAMAGIPIGVFVDELAERRIPLLRDVEIMEAEIAELRRTFGTGEEHVAEAAVERPQSGRAGQARPDTRRRQAV